MTALVKTPARRLWIAFATVCALLLLLDGLHLGPSWLHWAAAPLLVITALAVLVAAELGWERTLAAAQTAGLVATPGDMHASRAPH